MRAFHRTRSGVEAHLDAPERHLLRLLGTEVAGLLADGDVAADPVVARLLPDAHRSDPIEAHGLRALLEDDLRATKRAALDVLVDLPATPGPVVLDEDEAELWLRALNDVRLALGVRLELTEDVHERLERGELDPDDAWLARLDVYDALTWLQGSLIEALDS
jgi:hypothetical protein